MNGRTKLQRLQSILAGMGSALVAFSGGVDSTFLAAVAQQVLGKRATAITAASAFVPRPEIDAARAQARALGISHAVVKFSPPAACWKNGKRRCYFCKKALFSDMKRIARARGLAGVIEGSNLDDRRDFRPGAQALKELKVRSPLQESGFTKKDIRSASRRMGLSSWDRESSPCLATRIPYAQAVTVGKLAAVQKAEQYVHSLGIRPVRVRHHGDTCRIEVREEQIPSVIRRRRDIVRRLRHLGFTYCSVDLSGYRPGSLNEVL